MNDLNYENYETTISQLNIRNKPLVITTVIINPGVVFPCLDNQQIICGVRPIRNEDIGQILQVKQDVGLISQLKEQNEYPKVECN